MTCFCIDGLKRSAVAVLLTVLLCGCVTAPVQEMSDARQALQAAQAAHAAVIASEVYAAAQQQLQHAQAAIDKGDYRVAERHAKQARALAIEARQQALSK